MTGTVELVLLTFFSVSGLCLAGLALYLRSYPVQIRGIGWFRMLVSLMALWSFSAVGKIVLPVWVERALVALELPFGVVFVLVFAVFASQYTGRDWHRRRPLIAATIILLLVLAVALVTTPFHQLLWAGIGLSTAGFPHLVHTGLGPLYFVYVTISYGLYGLAVYWLADIHLRSRYNTTPIVLIVLGGSLPLSINVISVLDSAPVPGLDYTPIGLAAFGVATAWSIQMDFFDIVPIARDTAVEQSGEGMIILDADRRIRDYNPTAAALVPGLADHRSEPIGRVVADPADWFASAEGARTEIGPIGDDHRYLAVQVSQITDGPHHLGWAVTLSDITERQRRQRHLALVSRVLRHNMANRINAIAGHAELLRPHVDGEAASHLRVIDDSATSIIETSEKLRMIQRIITDDHTGQTVAVRPAVDRVVADYRSCYPDATLSVECPDDVVVRCGFGFEATIANLVENGIEHNQNPNPSVTVRVTVDDDHAHISVVDDATGIPETERQILEEGETPLRHSCGVGLWLAHCFVEQSGHDLRFERSAAGGSDVTFTLDRVRVDEP